MKHLLFIDDNAIEARLLRMAIPEEIIVHWVPSMRYAKEFLHSKIYPLNLICTDVVGTSYEENFVKGLDALKSECPIIITSNIMMPMEKKYQFVIKEDLAGAVKKILTS